MAINCQTVAQMNARSKLGYVFQIIKLYFVSFHTHMENVLKKLQLSRRMYLLRQTEKCQLCDSPSLTNDKCEDDSSCHEAEVLGCTFKVLSHV